MKVWVKEPLGKMFFRQMAFLNRQVVLQGSSSSTNPHRLKSTYSIKLNSHLYLTYNVKVGPWLPMGKCYPHQMAQLHCRLVKTDGTQYFLRHLGFYMRDTYQHSSSMKKPDIPNPIWKLLSCSSNERKNQYLVLKKQAGGHCSPFLGGLLATKRQ